MNDQVANNACHLVCSYIITTKISVNPGAVAILRECIRTFSLTSGDKSVNVSMQKAKAPGIGSVSSNWKGFFLPEPNQRSVAIPWCQSDNQKCYWYPLIFLALHLPISPPSPAFTNITDIQAKLLASARVQVACPRISATSLLGAT